MKRPDSIIVHVPLPTRREFGGLIRLAGLALLTAASAVVTKETLHQGELPVLAQTTSTQSSENRSALELNLGSGVVGASDVVFEDPQADQDECLDGSDLWEDDPERPWLSDPSVRYFNGRPMRPARTLTMLVTAYSPDGRSCGEWADGITASIHSVETNAGKLVAADTRILPMGSMISVPGYDEGRIVPVLDRGGAIKGNRLDVLFPTHEQARAWGVRRIRVTVWEIVDGMPADDYRKLRGKRRWR